MNNHLITAEAVDAYVAYLYREERAKNTVVRYLHDVRAFSLFLKGCAVTKETVTEWKEHLCRRGHSVQTVNGALASLHSFFRFMGWHDCRGKYLKVQRQMFRDTSKELTKEEYVRLVECARRQGNERLALLLETICGTGIRVSEVRYITVESVMRGRVEISLKGKRRTVLFPGKLVKKLRSYAKKQKIASGEIFITGSGRGISRRQIWGEMKRLCRAAGVEESKVFPHNLRHLFARSYYRICRDIVKLADVLGHSSVETTRIYLITTGAEHQKELDRLGLVV